MGVLGWNEIRDGQQLTGEVTRHTRAGDGDWCLHIVPDALHSRLLTNRVGGTNQDGTVEGEIEPNDDIDNDAMEAHFFDPLVGQRVTITGTFVEDKSHDDKTEIHPITSIFVDWGMVGSVKRVEFFVFSDDSANFPANVPHSGENRTGEFKAGYPPTPAADVVVPRFEVIELTDMAGSKDIQSVRQGDEYFLEGSVESGARGFYRAVILMWLDATNIALQGLNGQAFNSSPPKRFAMANGVWSLRYDVQGQLVPSNPGLALQNVQWSLQRRGQADLGYSGNPLLFQAVELSRDMNGQLDYHPQLSVQATVNGSPPFSIRRVLDLKRPAVVLELPGFSRQGTLAPHQGNLKKVVWNVECRATTQNFVTPPALHYLWTVAGHPTPAPTTIQTHSGNLQGNQLEFNFNLEYALPDKNTYDYTLSLVVTDGHGIEQATVTQEIHLPRPIAMIVGYGEDLRAGGRRRYRFTGEVAVENLLGAKSYFWAVDPKGWQVNNVGPTDRPDFSFEFDYQLPTRVGEFPPLGPQVTVTVTDEAGQVAKEIVDASNFVPELFRAKAIAMREARSLVELLRRGPGWIEGLYRMVEPRVIPPKPPIGTTVLPAVEDLEKLHSLMAVRMANRAEDVPRLAQDMSGQIREVMGQAKRFDAVRIKRAALLSESNRRNRPG